MYYWDVCKWLYGSRKKTVLYSTVSRVMKKIWTLALKLKLKKFYLLPINHPRLARPPSQASVFLIKILNFSIGYL